ncbi:MAG: malate dehydrogenase [Methanomicrobiales archaeon]
MARVTIIGATGRVGSFAAHTISRIPYVSELVLFGRPGREPLLAGIAHDMLDSFAACGTDIALTWSTDPGDIRGSDVVICTAGTPRGPGQDRIDLAVSNARLVAEYARLVGEIAPESIFLVITNPVDVMTAVALRASGMEPRQVLGLGTHLDSMRLKSLISQFFGVHVSEVHTRIIGEHGDSMVPLWSATTIGGIRIDRLPAFSDLPIADLMERVRTSGQYIIEKKGATVDGPGEAIATLIRTILGDEKRILTVSSYIRSEIHDIGGVCIGVPALVNRQGGHPVPIRIDDDEVTAFRQSVEKIRGVTDEILALLDQAPDTGH